MTPTPEADRGSGGVVETMQAQLWAKMPEVLKRMEDRNSADRELAAMARLYLRQVAHKDDMVSAINADQIAINNLRAELEREKSMSGALREAALRMQLTFEIKEKDIIRLRSEIRALEAAAKKRGRK